MRAGPHEKKIPDVLARIMRTEPGALRKRGLKPKARAAISIEPVLKIERRHNPRSHDVPRQVRQNRRLERLLNRGAIAFGLDPPVLSALQVGDRRKHVERVATLGRERRVGRGRAMQVEAEIGREALAVENIAKEFAIAGTEQDGVMRDVVVAAVYAKIPDEETHRIAGSVDLAVGPPSSARRGHEMAIGP